MDCDFCTSPRLVQRRSGAWLAISGRDESLKIGVIGATAADAEAAHRAAVRDWRAMLAAQATSSAEHVMEPS